MWRERNEGYPPQKQSGSSCAPAFHTACRSVFPPVDVAIQDSSGLTPMDVIADISAVKEVTNVLSRAMKRRSQHESRSSGASQSSTSLPTADSSPVSSDGGHHQRQIPDRIASPGVSTRGSSTESTPRRLSFNMGKTGSRHDYPYRENNYREEAESRPNTLGAGVCDDPCGASPEAYQDILPESDRFETSKDAVSQSGGGGGSSGGGSIRVKPLPPISSPGGYARRARAKVSVACDDEVLGHKQTSSDVRKELARGELSDERMGGAGSVITNDRNRFGHNANGVFTAAISCYGIADEGYQGCDVVNGAGVSREGDQQIEEERQENRGSSGGFHGDGEKGTSCGHYDKRRAGGADEPAVT